jgi:GntR family transcriptional repressor for pyruvate dehydrogenase complex
MKATTNKPVLLKRLSHSSVKDQVFEQLRNQILQRVWLPGMKIPSEKTLAKELGVSRISIREAIKMLSSLGLLYTIQGSGTYVAEYKSEVLLNPLIPMLALDITDIFDVLEYRRIVECGTVAIVVEKADTADIARLEAAYLNMQVHIDDRKKFAEADLEFHLDLAKATGNPIIIKINDIIKSILIHSMDNIVATLGVEDGLNYHRRILDAVEARDREGAMRLMEEHIDRTIARLKAHEKSVRETESRANALPGARPG